MKHILAGFILSLTFAGAASAQVVYYSSGQSAYVPRSAYPSNWVAGPPMHTAGQGYVTQAHQGATYPGLTYYEPYYLAYRPYGVVGGQQSSAVVWSGAVVRPHIIPGPCGWGSNCTTYDRGNTYTHPANQ